MAKSKFEFKLRCPYGHDSDCVRDASGPKPFASTYDSRTIKSTTTVVCETCKRAFELDTYVTVFYHDGVAYDQSRQTSDYHEIDGPWLGKLTFINTEKEEAH